MGALGESRVIPNHTNVLTERKARVRQKFRVGHTGVVFDGLSRDLFFNWKMNGSLPPELGAVYRIRGV